MPWQARLTFFSVVTDSADKCNNMMLMDSLLAHNFEANNKGPRLTTMVTILVKKIFFKTIKI